jgi:hypothetical protein
MSAQELTRHEKVSLRLTLTVLFTVMILLVSCAAGNRTVSEAPPESTPAKGGFTKTGPSGRVADITNYYRRPESIRQTPGEGLANFATENFIGSSRCAVCHEKLTDQKGNDMSISGHWRSTIMANAAKDPLWQAKVSSEVKRNPALKNIIETKCTTCHMPMAWTQAYKTGKEQLLLDEGFLSATNDLHEAAMDGVSCSLCHQIRDENLGQKKSFSGKFVIDVDKKAPAREIFGPYKNPVQNVMQRGVGYTPEYGPHINDSALCATCHTLFTPYVDAQGNVAGEFPEQVAYLEWKHSEYGINSGQRYDIGENPGKGLICQECHMPHSSKGGVYIANWSPPEAEPKDHFSQHHFVGGNVFMLNILQDNINALGLSASAEKLEDTKERTMHQLQHKTAKLALIGLDQKGTELTAVLQVNNKTGHKFPTGIPARRTWIHLTVTDAAGQVIFQSGKPLADGRIEGNDADDDIMSFEPHYDEITQSDQVQIYEGVMRNTDNEVTYTLMRAATFAKDNRLLPKGFNKAAVPAEIGVFGRAASDENFTGGSDLVAYRVNTAGHKGPFTVTARLLFTAVSFPFIMDLGKDMELSAVKRFMQFYTYADKSPQEITAIQTTVQ